ncbi:unnamed protein product [Amoebophrya sp. A25]|nr:unnamed protein product [Amoebophrya sp. A25]|eukprot:GSA25T00015381001.1
MVLVGPSRPLLKSTWGVRPTGCWGATKLRPYGGHVSDPYKAVSPLKPAMIGKTVTQWLTRESTGGLDPGAKKGTAAERLANFQWYAFPAALRDRNIEEIYNRAYALRDKQCMRAFALILKIP